MSNNHTLTLLGLAMRGGRLAVGEEPVEAVARARDARVLLLASDAAENTRRRCEHFAEAGQCLWLRIPFSKDELGRALGRSSVALAAITDVGLASAVVHRLAELDPVHYDEAAARLDVKAKRAAARKAEQLAHEKNLRTGRKRPKAPSPQQAPEPSKPPEAARPPGRPKTVPQGERHSPGPAAGTSNRIRSSGDKAPHRPGTNSYHARSFGERDSRSASGPRSSRPSRDKRPRPKTNPYVRSRPVKKGKGSFRKKDG